MVLHAADLYWSYPGERVFSVSANGVPVLTDYDVIAEAGEGPPNAAHRQTMSWCRTRMHSLQSDFCVEPGFGKVCPYMPVNVTSSGGQASYHAVTSQIPAC